MAKLSLRNLCVKYFYGAKAVDNLSMDCLEGEKIALLSDDEGGKTTILKCIAGLVPAESGEVWVGDRNITDSKTKDRNVCMILDDGGILKWHSVFFHLDYPLRIRRIPKAERRRRIDEVADVFGLKPNYHDLGRMLYSDDIIRLCFARAKLRNAPVTLIDDVFALADKGKRESVFREMLPHIQELSGVVLFATTEPKEAFSVGDKIVVMHYGVLQQVGTPEEIVNHPKTLYVEKLVSPLRIVCECDIKHDENSAFVEIFTIIKQFSLPKDYSSDKIIVSASLKEGGNNTAIVSGKYYSTDGICYATTTDGLYIKSDSCRVGEPIRYEAYDFKLYDYSTEKALDPD